MIIQANLFDDIHVTDQTDKYTKKVLVPQYKPNGTTPSIKELADVRKYQELLTEIKNSGVSDEEKQFLILASARHIAFQYSKIADYYANASPEMQRLMEKNALVILDLDDAIANGYVKLTERVREIVESIAK